MLELWHALVLGLVEGVTEFLPISSTGHLILASRALGLSGDFLKSFEIIIQLGAILAVPIFFGRRLMANLAIWKRVLVAFLPTAIIGALVYPLVKEYLLDNTALVLWALGLGGLGLIIFEKWHQARPELVVSLEQVTYRQVFLIGLAQTLAFVPGVSRAAATILGGLALGLPRRAIVEFSFLLAIPTMLAASGLDLVTNFSSFSGDQVGVLAVGFLVSFLSAYLAIKYLLRFLERHTFTGFGVYRIVLALAAGLIILT